MRRIGSSAHCRSTRYALATTRRLSKLATHSVGMPSLVPSRSSVGMSRIVRVTGAASTVFRTGIAAVRVITRKGRRPTSSISPHQISPRRGSVTTAPRQWRHASKRSLRQSRRRSAACADSQPRSSDRLGVVDRAPQLPRYLRAPLQLESRTPHGPQDHRGPGAVRREVARRSARLTLAGAYRNGSQFGMRRTRAPRRRRTTLRAR